LRIERTALPEEVPEPIFSEFRRVIGPYYEVFSPDVVDVASPNSRERRFYIGMPVPDGVDGRRVTIYGAGYGMVLCEPAEGSSCISGEQYSWNDFSSDGFYHPASNMYYTPVPNYPSGRPEYFVMVEMTGRASNRVREVLPWEDSGSNLDVIMSFQVDAEPLVRAGTKKRLP
jgi:hypothetical protein